MLRDTLRENYGCCMVPIYLRSTEVDNNSSMIKDKYSEDNIKHFQSFRGGC